MKERKALHAGRDSTQFSENPHQGGRGRGHHFPRGRRRECWHGRSAESSRVEPSHPVENNKQFKGVQCYVCKKYVHVKAQCSYRNKEANVVKGMKKEEEEEVACMAAVEEVKENEGTWLIDSGCSNHISGDRKLFHCIEATPKHSIKLGDGKALQVGRIGKVSLRSSSGKITTLNNVQFVPNLPHNFPSVG